MRAVESGSSIRQAALRFDVSPSAAVRLMRRFRQSGSPAPARFGGHRRPILEPHEALVGALLDVKAVISLVEIQAEMHQHDIMIGAASTISCWRRRAGLMHKKSLRAAEQDRPDVTRERQHWRVWQRYMDPARFVFLDETGTSTNMVRCYGRCPKGERLMDAMPWGTGRLLPLWPARASGLIAPMVLDRPLTGEVFRACVDQVLIPELSPGDVVVLDNLTAHKVAGIREMIQAAGASLLYLPPYSPDLNPIEQVFAKLKAPLRQAVARTKEGLWTTIGELLDRFTAEECQNDLSKCGYEFTQTKSALEGKGHPPLSQVRHRSVSPV